MCAQRLHAQSATCRYPGCHKGTWQNPDGSYSPFCSKKHRDVMQQSNGHGPSVGGAKLCKNCHSRPVYVDVNRTHDFCGQRCSAQYQAGGGTQKKLCKNCHSRPVYVDKSGTHEFCGKRCRDSFQAGVGGAQRLQRAGICKLPGCQKPVYVGPDGVSSDYCSRAHRSQCVQDNDELCLLCEQRPKATINGKLSDFCSNKCKEDTFDSAPIILNVTEKTKTFQEVAKQFTDQWKHPSFRIPPVVKIWKIYCDKDHADQFMSYKHDVERSTGIAGGNSRRRWHGTIRTCTIGDSGKDFSLCKDPNCSLCSIITTSFRIVRAGQRTNFGRFGAGIYTSATSSKSHDYAQQLGGGSKYKAMLLTDVVMGKTIKLTTGDPSLTEPPHGYDSVVGEPGGDLNYDEAIVYRDDAIRPLFLVIYDG
ncbi:uncharacterized protein B0H18DRAFT_55450 [Fomitopsis serialis]|uniref:uncharacterized protein n=1 Tax=Fomitopsis serialis TaxID=139415 RepID=UPI002007B22F|nr:uncharacterized protein B0H18DRAFT_55450 [Neoantrodia serialis]KAH9932383.1 hypothetical protein B0H18DRAFT_55450 [Neoantrodia serialis]